MELLLNPKWPESRKAKGFSALVQQLIFQSSHGPRIDEEGVTDRMAQLLAGDGVHAWTKVFGFGQGTLGLSE